MSGQRHDLGDGHWYEWVRGHAEHYPDLFDSREAGHRGYATVLIGIIEGHRTPAGDPCEGSVMFARPLKPSPHENARPVWTVTSREPLTVTPRVHCDETKGGCGAHGWITNGRWVPC